MGASHASARPAAGWARPAVGPARLRQVLRRFTALRRRTASDAPFQLMFTASPVAIGLSDENGKMIAVNPAMCALLGRAEAELLGSSTVPFTHPDDLHSNRNARALLEAAAANGDGVVRIEKRYVRPDGEVRWAWLTVTMTAGPRGEAWTLTHLQDVTERKAAEQALRDSEANLAAIAEVVRRLQTGSDPRQTIVDSATQIAGANVAVLWEPAGTDLVVTAAAGVDVMGTRIGAHDRAATADAYRTGSPVFLSDPSTNPVASPALIELLRARSVLCQPVTTKDGVIAVLTVTWAHRVPGVDDRAARAIGLLADEAGVALEHARMVRELADSAVTDALTGLPNRRGWDSRLEQLLAGARRGRRPLTVAIVDLDRFKAYNDERGHLAGDQLLRDFAGRVRPLLRDVDVVARWGGEEFVIAIPDSPREDVSAILERVRAAIPDGQTCSVGFAMWDGAEPLQHLLGRADEALYAAKQGGRNAVRGAD